MNRSGERRVALAAIAGAHGVTGEVRLKLFTESIDNLTRHDQLYVGGVPRQLMSIRPGKTAIARFGGISGRTDAEGLRGALVEVDRSALPPLEEGEYYHADLIGLPAVDRTGKSVGQVCGVENYGAGDLLEVEDSKGKRALIPFKPGIADLEENRIIVDREFLT